jgi:hypothetical protein
MQTADVRDERLTVALADLDVERNRANTLTVRLRCAEEELADTRAELATADAEVHRLVDEGNERTAPLPAPAGHGDLPPAAGDLVPAAIHDGLLAQPAYAQLRAEGGVYSR